MRGISTNFNRKTQKGNTNIEYYHQFNILVIETNTNSDW